MCFNQPSPPPPPKPQPLPEPTFTADDGTVFNDRDEFNAYNQNLRRTAFQSDLASAIAGARQGGLSAINERGLDETQYLPLINREIDRISGTIPDLDSAPDRFFGPTFGANVLDREQNRLRSQYGNQVSSAFTPNYAVNAIPDTYDDAVLERIFGERLTPAQQYVDRAYARGNLNDIGKQRALSILDRQGQEGRARLQSIGGDVLSGYRSQLGDVATNARNAASGYQLGSNFNLDDFVSRANTLQGNFGRDLEGNLRQAVGGEQLFNLDSLLAEAGSFQGAQNNAGGLLDKIAEREKQKQQARGLGTQGAF